MRFDLVDLRLFLHVADTASITHGAERSHLALASASARIRGMEETLGVDLLKRGRRGVALTPAMLNLAASANHSHRVHHTTKDTHDPNFNPAEFPLCFAWDFKLRRDVWICGRWAY